MTIEILTAKAKGARTIYLCAEGKLAEAGLTATDIAWAKANGYDARPGKALVLPGPDGQARGVAFGYADQAPRLDFGALAKSLPDGDWAFDGQISSPTLATVATLMGGYEFIRYRQPKSRKLRIAPPQGADVERARRISDGVYLARDLINTPTNDMGPDDLEKAVRDLATRHKAKVSVIAGDKLLKQNLNMIHAVGRAADQAPRLIDMQWGKSSAPKVTLVGKGVCFDTGGLDIKPASGMLLMKKDMGGAANVLGLASMIMAAKLNVRLRVLIPAVENSIAGNAFRPGDVLTSRKGITVEIGNTDAEGRLILADALSVADDDEPELLIDMATLTGAARVALGPDLPPYYTDDDSFAAELAATSATTEDPMWRMPLWRPYAGKLSSRIADLNNVTTDGFAGSITAALFLQRFVEKAGTWAHFDIFGWNPVEKPWAPVGGEAQCIRALEELLVRRYA